MAYGFLIYSVLYKDMPVGDFVLYFGAVAGLSTWLSGIVKKYKWTKCYCPWYQRFKRVSWDGGQYE